MTGEKRPHVCGPDCIDVGLPGLHVQLYSDALQRRLRTPDPIEFTEQPKVSAEGGEDRDA